MTAGMTAEALQRFPDAVEPERGGTVTVVTPLTGGYSRDATIGEVVWADGRLLDARLRREQQVMAGWSPTGR